MSKVLAVDEWTPKDGGDPRWYVTLDDLTDNVACYDPTAKALVIGDDLPPGWEVTKSKAGKDYLKTPAKSGGGAKKGGWSESYRQGKEAFDREQRSIHRAVAAKLALKTLIDKPWQDLANDIFEWLESSGGGLILSPSPAPEAPSSGWGEAVTASPSSSPPSTSEGVGGSAAGGVGKTNGEGEPTLLAKLSEAYGSGPKALKAARVLYHDAPPASLSALSVAQIQELIDKVS